jgi:hypothetical protein
LRTSQLTVPARSAVLGRRSCEKSRCVNVTVFHGLVPSGTTVTDTVHVAPGRTLLKSKWVLLPFALSLSKKGTRVGVGRATDAGAPGVGGAETGGDELPAGEFDGEAALGLEPPQPATTVNAMIQMRIPQRARSGLSNSLWMSASTSLARVGASHPTLECVVSTWPRG